MTLKLLKDSLERAQVMKRGQYSYFIHPLTDSIPPIRPELMKEVCDAIIGRADLDSDYILTMEAMGIHISAVLSQMVGVPVNIVRKRQYHLPGEIVLDQSTGYGRGAMYLNNVKRGDIVTIVDAVISTGGTLIAVISALQAAGTVIKDVICVIERGDGVDAVRQATGFNVKTLVKIDVADRVRILKASD